MNIKVINEDNIVSSLEYAQNLQTSRTNKDRKEDVNKLLGLHRIITVKSAEK